MADYDIFRERLGNMFPKYGHALWDPSPWKSDSVKVGDVGFIRMGKFHCLFNALCPEDGQSKVPEGYEPLIITSSPHITQRQLNSGQYCSHGIMVDIEQDMHLAKYYPDDPREVSMKCSMRRGGALLSLPVNARREDTLAQNAFGEWIVKHIDSWFAFAQKLQLGVEQMEEIILVTGCDRTRSWTNIAFLEGQVDAKGSYREKVVERADGIEIQFSSGHVAGGVLSHGPQGKNLPEDQCVFIRGFRVGRIFKIFPRHLKAAAGPSPGSEGYDCEPDTELISIPATTEYRDPLHVLLDYIAERAYDCDMVLVHDDDLERIDGIGESSSLESLQPEVVMDLLRSSDIEIHKVCCHLSSATGSSSPSSDAGTVWVAMLSMLSENWNSVLPSQSLPPTGHLQNPGPSPCPASESPVSPPAVPDRTPVPPILGDINLCGSGPHSRLGSVSHLPVPDSLSPSGMRLSLSMLTHVERHKLVATIAVASFAAALFGWMFSFNWLNVFKHWFTVLLASFALYLWFEREDTHRKFDEMHDRMEVLQHHIMSLQSNPTVAAFEADERNALPIMTKRAPENREMMGQRPRSVIQPPIASAGPIRYGEPLAEISHAHQIMAATPQESTRSSVELESSIVNLDNGDEEHIEHLGSNIVSGSTRVADPDEWPIAGPDAPTSSASDPSQFGKTSKATSISRTPAPHIPTELPTKPSKKKPLRIDTTLLSSPEHPRERPGPLNLQTIINTSMTPPFPEERAALGVKGHREDEEKGGEDCAEQEQLRKLQEEEEARAKEKAKQQRKDEEEIHTVTDSPENNNTPSDDSDSVPSLSEIGEIGEVVSQLITAATEEPASNDKSSVALRPSPSPSPPPHIPADLPNKPSESLRIDTTLPSSPEHPRKRPGPLNLLTTINDNIAPLLPSVLATARHIEDINLITYPPGIKRPNPELNVNTQKGKFRYDRDFLLQFMNICKEKPDTLPPLDVIGLEPSDTSDTMSHGASGRSHSLSMPSSTRPPSTALGFLPGSIGKTAGSGFQMNQFSTSASKMSSEERFLAAYRGRSVPVSDDPLDSRPLAMLHTIGQSTGHDRHDKYGTNDPSRTRVTGNAGAASPISTMGPPMGPAAPLVMSANRWVATSSRNGSSVDNDSPDMVERKVKALLNKLTRERFDSISDQIIAWANKSERDNDGRTMIQVIKLIFEKATDEATFSEMYARLCHKLMDQISSKVQDDGMKNAQGKPYTGGQLFRKYLLNHCQTEFERGWVARETTAAAAAFKVTEGQANREANEQAKAGGKSELYSDEYYAAANAKRRGLGLICFIAELFKSQMLSERIMHECITKLLGDVENPGEEEIESLCKLLTMVGSLLDTQKARAHFDVYFLRMRELTKNKNVNPRMVFMLQDVIELRERRWIPRNAVAAPTTIAQIHEAAAKEKQLAQEKDTYMWQNASMSRAGSRRGGNRDAAEPPHPDGWSVAGSGAPARQPPKAGDLSQFGKINKATPISFAPGSIFTGKKGTDPKNRDPPMSRTPSTRSNMFSMLQNPDAVVEPSTSKSSRPPSRKPSVDLASGASSDPVPQRPKLWLLPRSLPVGEESRVSTPAVSESDSEDEGAGPTSSLAPATMSEAESKAKIEEDIKEFFVIRMLDEGESYFSNLPPEHRHLLVDALVLKSIEMKESDVVLVSNLFLRVREKELCSPTVFEEGFNGLAELLDDLAVDIPKAWTYFAILLKGSGLDQDEERRGRIAEKTMDPDKLNRLL